MTAISNGKNTAFFLESEDPAGQKIRIIAGTIISATGESNMPALKNASDKTMQNAQAKDIRGIISVKLFFPFFLLTHNSEQVTMTNSIFEPAKIL